MANLTLSVPDDILLAAREAAFRRGTTVNAVCREALERLIGPDQNTFAAIDRAFKMADELHLRSTSPFSREEIYEERLPGRKSK
jgi:hypothetical protein